MGKAPITKNPILWLVLIGGGFLLDRYLNAHGKNPAVGLRNFLQSHGLTASSNLARAYDSDSGYKMLLQNPYYMNYGPYGGYYGRGYDYLSDFSPK